MIILTILCLAPILIGAALLLLALALHSPDDGRQY